MHSGHTSRISDFSWDPMERWVMASAGEDNILQLWEMASTLGLLFINAFPLTL